MKIRTFCFVLASLFFLATGVSSCKKCYTCSFPYAAVPGYASGASQYCFKKADYNQIAGIDSACLQLGGVWTRGSENGL
jgi:hypothetical protein